MDILEYDRRYIWHPYASIGNPPPVRLVKSARGTELTLSDGKTLTDSVSSWWCVAHGHSHPAIVEAIRRQSERLSHVMFGGLTHEPAVELAEALDRLNCEDRGIVLLSVIAGMSSGEIADLTGLPAGTVRSKLSRSLAKMREFLS